MVTSLPLPAASGPKQEGSFPALSQAAPEGTIPQDARNRAPPCSVSCFARLLRHKERKPGDEDGKRSTAHCVSCVQRGKSNAGILADELFRKEAKLFRVSLIHEYNNKFLHTSLFKCRQALADGLGAANQA